MSSALGNNIEAMFSQMENFVSSKTVVGEPMEVGGIVIVPLIDVSFGMGASGSELKKDANAKKDGSVGALGAKMSPSAVLVIMNGTVQLVNVKNQNSINKLIDLVPGVMSKFNFGAGNNDKDIVVSSPTAEDSSVTG